MKKIIGILAALIPLAALGFTFPEDIDKYEVETSPVFDEYSAQCTYFERTIYNARKNLPFVNFRYERGVLYVKYTDLMLRNIPAETPEGVRKFGYDDSGILRLGWIAPPHSWADISSKFLWDMSFSIEYSGDFEVDLCVLYASKEFENNKRITLSTYEGMDVSIRLDAINYYYNQEYLYAKVKDGKTTGGYAVEKFIGEETVDGKTYKCLYRCDGMEFDESKAELIAYMREDGISNYVLPPDKELPLSIWVDGAEGSVNLFEMCGGKEKEIYKLFDTGGSYCFFDFPLGRLDLSDITQEENIFDYASTKQTENMSDPCRVLNRMPLHRKATTSSGIIVIEDVGTLGECVHSLAYPTFFGTDGNNAVQKLVRANAFMCEYRDESLYQEYVSGIDGISADDNDVIRYADNRIVFLGDKAASLKVFDMNGIIRHTHNFQKSGTADLSALSHGAYTAILETGDSRQIRKILVK